MKTKTSLKKFLRAARGTLAPGFLREAHAKLRTSRASGSSFGARVPVIARLLLAKAQNPQTIVGYAPPVPKIAKLVAPGVYRARPPRKVLKPCRAEVETLLTSATSKHKHYARLTNGQIVKAYWTVDEWAVDEREKDNLVVPTPGSLVTLRPEDQKQLPQQALPRA